MCLDLLCTLCEVGDQAHSKACILPVGGAAPSHEPPSCMMLAINQLVVMCL